MPDIHLINSLILQQRMNYQHILKVFEFLFALAQGFIVAFSIHLDIF